MTPLQYLGLLLLTGLATALFCGFHRLKADETIAATMVCALVWPIVVPVAVVFAACRIAYALGDGIRAMVRQ